MFLYVSCCGSLRASTAADDDEVISTWAHISKMMNEIDKQIDPELKIGLFFFKFLNLGGNRFN